MYQNETDEQAERRIGNECRTHYRGTLGNRDAINVARVEVQWWDEHDDWSQTYHGGYFFVHASGEEPEAEGDGGIYAVFSELTHAEMERCKERGKFDGYEILDISAA